MAFHLGLVLAHRIGLQREPERLAGGEREEGIDQFGREQAAALGAEAGSDLFGMGEHGLVGMEWRRQHVDAVGEEDQVGMQCRAGRQRRLLLQPRPAAVVVADDRREMGERREIGEQFLAAQAVRLGTRPFEVGDEAAMDARRRNAAVVQQAGIVEQELGLLVPAELARQFAGEHANPATVQQVVDADQVDRVGDRHDQLAQVDRKVGRQARHAHGGQFARCGRAR